MSTEQQETLDAILRQSAFRVGSSVDEQRQQLRALGLGAAAARRR